jgi:hypothetical protein
MKFKLFFAALILLTLACSQLVPTAIVTVEPAKETEPATAETSVEATQMPAATETPTEVPTEAPAEEIVFGKSAREHITAISEGIGARWAETTEEVQTAEYVKTAFAEMGYEPQVVPFRRSGWVDDETEAMFASSNVIAVKQGDSQQVIVVGAHYDSSYEGLGADDNASGVGILLELAEQLVDVATPYTIHFVAFGAEEVGLLGSQAYVLKLGADEIANTIGMINIDSVIAGDFTYVYCNERKPALRDWSLAWAEENGFALQTIRNVDLDDEEGYGTADTDLFESVGIPFAYFESTNWALGYKDGYTQVDPQYGEDGAIIHTQYDTLKYLDETFPGRVDERLNSVVTVLYNLLTQYPN